MTRVDMRNLLVDEQDRHLIEGRRLSLHSHGYVRIGREYLHRLIVGAGPNEIVDHINSNTLDCRRANLRKATKAQNGFNRGKAGHNTSGFKGVSLCKQTGRFRAEITHNGRKVKLGRFPTAEQAARAYDMAAARLHGAFARPNFTAVDDPGSIGKGCDA